MAREATSPSVELPHETAQGSGIEKEQLKQIEQMREYFSQYIEEYEEVMETEDDDSVDFVAEPAGSCFRPYC